MKMNIIDKHFKNVGGKITSFLLIITVIMLILNLFLNEVVIRNYFSKVENQDINLSVKQCQNIFDSKAKELELLVQDYSIWDETYKEVQQKNINEQWFKNNFTEWLPKKYGVDLIAVFNKEKKVVSEYYSNKINSSFFLQNKKFTQLFTAGEYNENMKFNGFVQYNGDLYIIGVCPIYQGDYKGAFQGVVVLGYKITSKYMDNIKEQYGNDVFITYGSNIISSEAINSKIRDNINVINNSKENVVVLKGKDIVGRIPISDVEGNKIGYINSIKSNDILITTQNQIDKNTFCIFLIFCVLIHIIGFIYKDIIVKPIKSLEKQIENMIKENSLTPVKVKGPDEILSLAESFNHMIGSILNHKKENRELRIHTNTDYLTSLYNHKCFYETFNNKIVAGCKKIIILFCDIDRFKEINDSYGHTVGDLFLKETAKVIKNEVRDKGMAFRYGGEEFIVMLWECTSEEALEIGERIRNSIINHKVLQVYADYQPATISIGIAVYPKDGLDAESLIKKADSAMYYSKQNGRNQCNIYNEGMKVFLKERISKYTKSELMMDSVLALAEAIDAKDSYTSKHSKMVSKYSLMLADGIGLSEKEKSNLLIGSLLHDCGKIGIPDNIIHKPDKLTEEEYSIVRNHSLLGYNIIKHIVREQEVVTCVRNHHERWDGKGYPDGLSCHSIHLYARIVCIADAYHAMTSDRPYRKALTQEEALEELVRNKGTQFDPDLVDVFVKVVKAKIEKKKKGVYE